VTDIFPIMLPRVQKYETSQFQCLITSLLLILEQKIVFTGYWKSYPWNPEMFSILNFDLNFKVKLRPFCLFYTKNVCKMIYNSSFLISMIIVTHVKKFNLKI
jgi:hypothetical protein